MPGEDSVAVDSIAKVGILVAAFRLRHQLRLATEDIEATKTADVIDAVTKYWDERVRQAFPGYGADFPNLKKLIKEGDAKKIEFSDEIRDTLKKMIAGRGDNASARKLIDLIGFQYLNGALHTEGCSEAPGKGIWIWKNFGSLRIWKGAPVQYPGQGGSLQALTSLFIELFRWKAIDEEASQEMCEILETAGLWATFSEATYTIGKIGLLKPARLSQVGLYRLPFSYAGPFTLAPHGEFSGLVIACGFPSEEEIRSIFERLLIGIGRRHLDM
jgi:hypothetical protein